MRNRTYFCPPIPQKAWVAELVDALDSKSSSLGSAGSIPASGTINLAANELLQKSKKPALT